MYSRKEISIELANLEKSSEYQNPSGSTDKIIDIKTETKTRQSVIKWLIYPSPPSYWSSTFGLATLPWILCGFPSHAFLRREEESHPPAPEIKCTSTWFKYLFDFSNYRLFASISLILGIISFFLNLFVLTLIVFVFHRLFVSPEGDYKTSFVYDAFTAVCLICQILCLDYVWIYGFKIKRLVANFDQKYAEHPKIKCRYRLNLVGLVMVIIVALAVRIAEAGSNAFEVDSSLGWVAPANEKALLFSNSIFISFFFLVYVTFAFAIRFELVVLKSFIYSVVHRRLPPSVAHLSRVKTLFTSVANHIVYVNRLFWALSAVTIVIVFCFVLLEASELRGIIAAYCNTIFQGLGKSRRGDENKGGNSTEEWDGVVQQFHDRDFVHKVNLDIIWVGATLGIVGYTLWETIVTNDYSRNVTLWVNDMATGGGGTDSAHLLDKLLLEDEEEENNELEKENNIEVVEGAAEESRPLQWAGMARELDGEDYGDIGTKVLNLRQYINVRMKHDNPSLLSIMLFGSIIPLLKDRLQGYPY